ncbi:GNAT family N-acetyltransferase [Streptomyces sp. NPDC053079]|uniref:GNAT family N-acetyltransferase n=1 Tax=Streptomyces sp. NPDC053079 TaxID=3365697 RepID=UPI0037D77361
MPIRDADPTDWPAIWPFFRDIITAGDTYTYPRDLTFEQGREWWLLTAPGRTVVAVDDDGTVLGSAKMNPNQMGGGSHIASASFMVAPEHAGRGVGRALGEHAIAWARAEGYRGMQFNAVVEANTRAVALWRSLGFTIVGTIPDGFRLPDGSYTGLHVMHRPLR